MSRCRWIKSKDVIPILPIHRLINTSTIEEAIYYEEKALLVLRFISGKTVEKRVQPEDWNCYQNILGDIIEEDLS